MVSLFSYVSTVFLLTTISLFCYIKNREKGQRIQQLLEKRWPFILWWGYPRGGGHRCDRQARRRFNSD